jgi:murein L,D-transpeptidase YcbB/YkuD
MSESGKQRVMFVVPSSSVSLILDASVDAQAIADQMAAELRDIFNRHLGSLEWDLQPLTVEARTSLIKNKDQQARDWDAMNRRHEQMRQELAAVIETGLTDEREVWNQIRDEPIPIAEMARDALLRLMHDLCEQAYRAAWVIGIEYELWSGASSGPRKLGRREALTAETCHQLRQLANLAGGWWRSDEDQGEVFTPLDEWKRHLHARQQE